MMFLLKSPLSPLFRSQLTHMVALMCLLFLGKPTEAGEVIRDLKILGVETIFVGSYVVSVHIEIVPGDIPPVEPVLLQFIRNGMDTVGESELHFIAIIGGCCDEDSDCKVEGYTYWCESAYSCPGPPYTCLYRATYSFQGFPLNPGDELMAVLNADGWYTETEPGAGSNNTYTVIVPPDIVTGDIFVDFGINDVRFAGVSGGFYDVVVDIEIGPEIVAPSQSIMLRLLEDNMTEVGSVNLETADLDAQVCCRINGPCPSPPEGTVSCSGLCTDEEQRRQGYSASCVYGTTISFNSLALTPGATLVAVLDPDGVHAETAPDAELNNTFSATVPTGVIPTLTEWGMIIFCVLLFGWMAWVIVRRRKAVNVRI
jgi:hypothetical protein